MIDLEPATEQMAAIVGNIGEEQLGDPTPSERTNVADILAHVYGLTIAFRDAAVKISGPTTAAQPPADGADLPLDWRYSIVQRLSELAQAWRAPEAWQGETVAGGVRMLAEQCGLVVNNELVLHAWDLARATGRPYEPDAASAEVVHAFTAEAAQQGGIEGLFGPPVEVPADAPLFDRALGFSGRDPAWVPGHA